MPKSSTAFESRQNKWKSIGVLAAAFVLLSAAGLSIYFLMPPADSTNGSTDQGPTISLSDKKTLEREFGKYQFCKQIPITIHVNKNELQHFDNPQHKLELQANEEFMLEFTPKKKCYFGIFSLEYTEQGTVKQLKKLFPNHPGDDGKVSANHREFLGLNPTPSVDTEYILLIAANRPWDQTKFQNAFNNAADKKKMKPFSSFEKIWRDLQPADQNMRLTEILIPYFVQPPKQEHDSQ